MTATPWHGGELRQDPLTGEWSVLAPHRARRPHTGAVGCPFCPGPSEDTPPETWRLPALGGGWLLRSVRNRYALSDHHEVIIESPLHDWDLATGTDAEAANVLAGDGAGPAPARTPTEGRCRSRGKPARRARAAAVPSRWTTSGGSSSLGR
ncbi:hypothetical protein ACFWQL_01620 [Amycolatopsis thermoflava]|uniref:hypothetical protein n=1 Tax=Amycolatopsis thermoflava TaxID=84480 RepID=UPI00365B5D4D